MIALLLASQVARVVVFPDRAAVTRVAEVTCGQRPVRVEFNGLPPAADPSSLRASASAGVVESVDAVEEPRAAAFSAQAEELEARLRRLAQERAGLRDERKSADAQSKLAEQLEGLAVTRIGQEVAQPDPEAWRLSLQQTLKARMEAARKRSEIRVRNRALREQILDVRRKMYELGAARERKELRAVVLIACPPGRAARVELTYLVGGASWEPAYEARAEDDGVSLALNASVRQSTGEDWVGARLLLSTAVPSDDATPPEIQPLRVFAEKRPPPRKVLVRRDEQQHHAEPGGAERYDAEGMAVEDQGLSVQLAAPEPATVRGDGTAVRVFVARTRLAATFAWKTVPRQVPNVFRVADLVDTAPFPLLAGQVELFRGGSFLGKVPLERVAQGARFHLSFGLADEVKVKRVVVDEIARDHGIFKKAQRFHYAYRFEVENGAGGPQTIELSEAVPVSELSDVTVELEDRTTPGFSRNLEDGIVTWKLALKPGEKRSLQLAFHVDVPEDYAAEK